MENETDSEFLAHFDKKQQELLLLTPELFPMLKAIYAIGRGDGLAEARRILKEKLNLK